MTEIPTDKTYCRNHARWVVEGGCLGRHQRPDSEEMCFYYEHELGTDIMRKYHNGLLNLEDTLEKLEEIGPGLGLAGKHQVPSAVKDLDITTGG